MKLFFSKARTTREFVTKLLHLKICQHYSTQSNGFKYSKIFSHDKYSTNTETFKNSVQCSCESERKRKRKRKTNTSH